MTKKYEKDPKIVFRNWGKAPRKHSVMLKYLTSEHRAFLEKYEHLKFLEKDKQVFGVIFRICWAELFNKGERALLFNPYENTFSNYRELVKSSERVPWNCAICKDPIQSTLKQFEPSNFLCAECQKAHPDDAKIIDSRIKQSSIEFTRYYKNVLKEEQKRYLKFVKRNFRGQESDED